MPRPAATDDGQQVQPDCGPGPVLKVSSRPKCCRFRPARCPFGSTFTTRE
jgi:hypothetical protein